MTGHINSNVYGLNLLKNLFVKIFLDCRGSSDNSIPTISPKIDGIAKRLPQESQPKGAHHFAKPNKVNTTQITPNETTDFRGEKPSIRQPPIMMNNDKNQKTMMPPLGEKIEPIKNSTLLYMSGLVSLDSIKYTTGK